MYDELVERLRKTSCGAEDTLWWQAADAIEELQKLLMRQEVKLIELTGKFITKMMKEVAYWMPPKEE